MWHHASDFGFDSDNIGLLGFSAGGNQISTYINLIMGNTYSPEEYTSDEVTREKLLQQTDLNTNFNSSEIPQFIAYGTKDGMVNMEGIKAYIEAAESVETKVG